MQKLVYFTTILLFTGIVGLAFWPAFYAKAGAAGLTCDLCGKCGDKAPPDWAQCSACVHQEGHSWTVLGCLPTSPGGFVQAVLQFTTSLVGGIAFLALLYGGGIVLTSAGNPERLTAGKGIIFSAIIGILLVVFAVFILRFIGVAVFGLPGFGG